ncbi:MAG TPA: hypothetical protein VJG90_03375 [Candidatus Nanoarchaeia archaeon]|nr:hypothetical protein [Candidatus Nanoarchaeia archaeon]
MQGDQGDNWVYRLAELPWKVSVRANIRNHIGCFFRSVIFRGDERTNLVEAHRIFSGANFLNSNQESFVEALLSYQGCEKAKREFPEFEYELKWGVNPSQEGAEPSLRDYLQVFNFRREGLERLGEPIRYLPDPAYYATTTKRNHYFFKKEEKSLVVMEGDNLYLKEKGPSLEVNLGVSGEEWVVKRKESEALATLEDVLKAVSEGKSVYQGSLHKETAERLILDIESGRFFSLALSRSGAQGNPFEHQLEVEYSGFIPGFVGLREGSEEQLVSNLVELGNEITRSYLEAKVHFDWGFKLARTRKRKLDFAVGGQQSL